MARYHADEAYRVKHSDEARHAREIARQRRVARVAGFERGTPEEREKWRAKYYKDMQRQLHSNAKVRAKKHGYAFDLEVSDVVIPEACPVFGIPFEWGVAIGRNKNSPSLDRIIPEKGYTKGNVKVISWKANRLKNDATKEDLEKVLAYLSS